MHVLKNYCAIIHSYMSDNNLHVELYFDRGKHWIWTMKIKRSPNQQLVVYKYERSIYT